MEIQNTTKKDEQYSNEILINMQYKLIAMKRFKWTGLPETIEEKHIEKLLYEDGQVAIINSDKYGFIALPCHAVEKINVLGEYVKYTVNGYGYIETFDTKADNPKIVVLKNNDLAIPTRPYVDVYARRLNEIERTLDVNISQQKTPYVVKVAKSAILSFKNLFKKVKEDEPVIYADKTLDLNAIEVFPTVSPFIGIEMMDYKNQVKNELLTFLGINNANTDKKERLLDGEVKSNNELITSNFEVQLESRKYAAEQLNKIFGWSITVEPRVKEQEEKTDANNSNDTETTPE